MTRRNIKLGPPVRLRISTNALKSVGHNGGLD
jgi:ribosomal protein L28